MTQITLRGIDPELERKIRMLAKKTGRSLNRVILDMIHTSAGLNRKDKSYPAESLRKLAGGWSEEDAEKFFESIKLFEQIDEEMWT